MGIPSEVAVAIIVIFVVYPFAIFGLSAWLSRHNIHRRFFRAGLIIGGLAGIVLAVAFLTPYRISKYISVDVTAVIVFVMSTAATGGLLGSSMDRYTRLSKSTTSASQLPDE